MKPTNEGRTVVLVRTPDVTYADLRARFSWELPPDLNMGVVCTAHPAGDLALVVADGNAARDYTFGDLADLSDRFANGLAGLGIGRGDRVAIMLPQGLEVGVAHLSVYKLGGIAVPLTQLFGPDAIRYRLEDSGARAIVVDTAVLDKVADIVAGSDLDVIVVAEEVAAPHHSFDDLLGAAHFEAARTGPDDPGLLIYTSGTTGAPKGALHGHRVLCGHLPGFELMFDFFPQDGDRMWTPADWAWIGGLLDALLPSWFHGHPVVAAPRARFDPEWAIRLMADHGVRNTFLPPTALKLMREAGVSAPDLDLRSVASGGEPLGAEMLAWGEEHLGVTINEIYGQTEANLLVGNCSSVCDVRPGSMGRPYPGHDVAILRDGALAKPGEDGEIVSRAGDPVHFLEYWNRPDATEEKYTTVDGERWLLTGDVGHVDDDGYLRFTARGDDVITSAGYRIGPAEIEECIVGHPAVAMVASIGVPDDVRGHVVKVFVQLAEGFTPSEALEEEIRERVKRRLAAYEYPREIEFVSELPLTTTGKIRRLALREREAERRREATTGG